MKKVLNDFTDEAVFFSGSAIISLNTQYFRYKIVPRKVRKSSEEQHSK